MAVKYLPAVLIIVSMLLALVTRGMMQGIGGTIVAPALTGDVLIVTTPTGRRIIIDTGNDAPQLLEFLGQQTPLWAPRTADMLVLTQTGAAWQGALHALVTHGVSDIVVLPAAQPGAHAVCTSTTVYCRAVSVGSQWQYHDITMHVVAPNMMWLVWPHGSVLVAHGATSTQLNGIAHTLECPRQPCFISYGWQITPPWTLHDALRLSGVLYSSGQTQRPAARLSMAQRRPYHERLWHEQLNGTITLTFDNPTRIRVSEVFP